MPSTTGATAKIRYNRLRNIDGRRSNGAGGWQTNDRQIPISQYRRFVQFDKGNGLVDTEVAWNEVINEPYVSRVKDVINFYQTTGSSNSPILVHNNYIEGAYPLNPGSNSFSGGGIMLGDDGGRYQRAYDNQVVSTANYGVAIAGGRDSRIDNNRVISCGHLADGTYIASQNVGLYVWNNSPGRPWGNNTGTGNFAGWTRQGYPASRNDWWVPDAASWTNNTRYSPTNQAVPSSAEVAEFAFWQQKVSNAGVVIGPVTAAPPAPTVGVGAAVVEPGAQIQVTVADGPSNRLDWVGGYPVGTPFGTAFGWSYLNGSQTPPASGASGAVLAFTVPSTPGNYEFRFCADDGFDVLAVGDPVRVR